ncbi:MAG: aldose 1-epimerase [Candidatus Roseilinea sp.]|nr:MAG: aldose 1-epimerase [Candidatus Roseilinea sp.]
MNIRSNCFGHLPDGATVDQYTLENDNGMSVQIITYGGIITALRVPDRAGDLDDVVLGFDNLDGYLAGHPYFGCIVGRFANRIAGGRFTLDGLTYQLAVNNGPNHLHGGLAGFDKKLWRASIGSSDGAVSLALSYLSPDGEENYPGNLHVTVTYTLTHDNALRIGYRAHTDKPTILNLTNHTYFNLASQGDILDHEIMINADHFTPVNEALIPTGELQPVAGTPLDFRQPMRIGARIDDPHEQIARAGGYDHNFVINGAMGELRFAARVYEPSSGRTLEVHTTEPGMQFYSGNFLSGAIAGKGGRVYGRRAGLCLETQHFPDSPNQPGFPSVVLRPGERFASTTVFRFSTR